METTSAVLYSKVTPFSFSLAGNKSILSFRPFSKHLDRKLSVRNSLNHFKVPVQLNYHSIHVFSSKGMGRYSLECSSHSSAATGTNSENPLLKPHVFSSKGMGRYSLECSSHSSAATGTNSENPLLKPLKNFSWESLKSALLKLTPLVICKWSLVFAIAIAASKWSLNVMFNPFFWMYFSWTWLFWPWMLASSLALYGFYCLKKYLRGVANVFEELVIVTAAFTWLTLVPPAHFNGFLEGWPFVFFFVYHYFFFFNVSVRKRLYGDYNPREHDPKWDITLPNWHKLLFCVGVMIGHWFAAFEGPELHLVPGGWSNVSIWMLIMLTLFMQHHSTLYLAKYSEKVVVPTAVVQFGPYRFVRHPIYASTMLLFVTYFTALRAPLSSLFIIVVCLMYYGQKARIEEDVMVEAFGEKYTEYASKVKCRLIPFVY